jgi:hypothetical protein
VNENFAAQLADKVRFYGAYSPQVTNLLAEHDKEVLDAYKARVLAVAEDVKVSENWCDEGFAQAMRELDIEPPKREWEVSISVTAYQNVTVKVQASSEDEAMQQAGGMTVSAVMEACPPEGWAHESHDVDEAWVS